MPTHYITQKQKSEKEYINIKLESRENPVVRENITWFELPCKQETILWVSSMNFFLPLIAETPTPFPLKERAVFLGVSSWKRGFVLVRLLTVWISWSTFGISIMGGLFRFKELQAAAIANDDSLVGFLSISACNS
jgi:hypothetical protein